MAQSNKKDVLVYGMNYSPEFTGVGRYTGEIGSYLAQLGWKVVVITTPPHYPEWKARVPYKANRWAKESGTNIIIYRCPLYLDSKMRGIKRMLAPLSFAISSAPVAIVQAILHRPRTILVIEPTLFVAPLAAILAYAVGAKLAIHVQDLEVDAAFAVGHLKDGGVIARFARSLERAIMRRFDRVITISGRMREKLLEKSVSTDRMVTIRNWVDLEIIKPLTAASQYREELGIASDVFVALYAGAIGAKQGIGLIVEAATILSSHGKIVFVVAGDGPMRPALEEASKSLPNLIVLPFQPEARFSEFLGLADMHVLPQERGAADLVLPSKLGGMLASGRRIVATADEGTELAQFLDGSCTLVPPGDAVALAGAVLSEAGKSADSAQAEKRVALARTLEKSEALANFERAILAW